MNNWINRIIIVGLSVGILCGCTKFLDLPAKNERTIQNLGDIKSVLAGYLYSQTASNGSSMVGMAPLFNADMVKMFEAYADNIDVNEALRTCYLVDNNSHMEEKEYANLLLFNDFDTPRTIWIEYYETIGFLNALIDEMDGIGYDDQGEYDRILGEMLTNRAYYFFKLLEYFAPYQDGETGIPVYLHTGQQVIGVKMERKTQAEVYRVILDDLTKASALLERSGSKEDFNFMFTFWRLNHILAQVYWFKAGSPVAASDDWANARKYASAAVKGVDEFIPSTTLMLNSTVMGYDSDYPGFYMGVWGYNLVAGIWASGFSYNGNMPLDVPADKALYELFTEDDIRTSCYFSRPGIINNAWPDGSVYGKKNGRVLLFRPEEAFLILAEAEYYTGGDALGVLNKFKSFRKAGTFSGSGEILLEEIHRERRKEFFGDSDKRWLDLKRYGGATLTRNMVFFEKEYHLTVVPNDFRYALPIPLDELQHNNELSQNEGWVQIEF